jgi:hypothetical protein
MFNTLMATRISALHHEEWVTIDDLNIFALFFTPLFTFQVHVMTSVDDTAT